MKQEGPKIKTEIHCYDCIHLLEERYERQGDSGTDTYCTHDNDKKSIGDTTWKTPLWCPCRSNITSETRYAVGPAEGFCEDWIAIFKSLQMAHKFVMILESLPEDERHGCQLTVYNVVVEVQDND